MSTSVQPMLIGGRWLAPEGAPIDVLDPATEALVGRIGEASPAQVEAALAAARSALSAWSALPPPVRARQLLNVAAALTAARRELAMLMTTEQGKPLQESLGEVDKAAETFVFYAEEAKRWPGAIIATTIRPIRAWCFTNPSASWSRSRPGTTPWSWSPGRWRRPSPPVVRSSSSRPS